MEWSVSLSEVISYLLVGGVAGLLAGLLGVGGGIVVVPALVWLMPVESVDESLRMHVAVATSLCIMIPTALVSALKHHRLGNLLVTFLPPLGIAIAIGSIVGVLLAKAMPRGALQALFAVFELLVAWQLIRNPSQDDTHSLKIRRLELFPVGIGIGALSSLLGIGGGTMTVPYLNWRGVQLRQAIGTSAACGLVIAITGALVFFVTAPGQSGTMLCGYIYLPAAICVALSAMLGARYGAGLGQLVPVTMLRHGFALLLLVVATLLIWRLF